MSRCLAVLALSLLTVASSSPLSVAQEAAAAAPAPAAAPLSFMKDVAPVLVQNCIACHNARKSDGKYNMINFKALVKGGPNGAAVTPSNVEESYLVDICQPDAEPRMPYKQAPLKPETLELLTRWVKEGAVYDGTDQAEDWTALLHKQRVVAVPESYPLTIPITALAFSPDNSQIATSGYHEINFWKKDDGVLGRRLRGLSERVYDLVYSPDGKWIATASGDPGQYGKAQLWAVEPDGGGKPTRDLAESNDVIYAVAFSPDSQLVACAGADRTIRIMKVETGEAYATIEDHADWIYDLAFSPDGKRLASASRDKTTKVFDVEKKESLVTFPGHGEVVYAVGWMPDSKTVVSGGADSKLRWWNPDEDGKQIREAGTGGIVFQTRATPDGASILACCSDKTVKVITAADGKVAKTLAGHGDWVYSVAVSPDGKTAASGGWDGAVIVWDLAEGKALRTITAAPGYAPPAPPATAAK